MENYPAAVAISGDGRSLLMASPDSTNNQIITMKKREETTRETIGDYNTFATSMFSNSQNIAKLSMSNARIVVSPSAVVDASGPTVFNNTKVSLEPGAKLKISHGGSVSDTALFFAA